VTSPVPARGRLSIGEVLSSLRPEFPDVTISKIRYLEAEGLLEPERSRSGYRKFSSHDVDRLRYILAAQRDSFFPLKVIREQLEAIDRGLQPDGADGRPSAPRMILADDGTPTAASFRPEPYDVRLSRRELLAEAAITEELLAQIEQYGLVRSRGRGGHYDGTAVEIGRAVGELAAYGLEPRHLRAFKTAADREVGLFEQIVSPLHRQRDAAAAARAEETVQRLAALSIRLHTMLVKSGLRDPR